MLSFRAPLDSGAGKRSEATRDPALPAGRPESRVVETICIKIVVIKNLISFINMEFINIETLLSGLFGVIIGTIISGIISWKIFKKQNKIDRYINFVDEIDLVLNKNEEINQLKAVGKEKRKERIEKLLNEINLILNKAYSKAMISMDDKMFKKITVLLNKDFDKKNRNRIYYLMRKDIFRRTKIPFEDVMTKYIQTKISIPGPQTAERKSEEDISSSV